MRQLLIVLLCFICLDMEAQNFWIEDSTFVGSSCGTSKVYVFNNVYYAYTECNSGDDKFYKKNAGEEAWHEITSPATNLSSCKFLGHDNSLFIYSTWGGQIVRSDDGGETWISIPVEFEQYSDYQCHVFFFGDTMIVPSMGYNEQGQILYSLDKGDTWSSVSSPFVGSYYDSLGTFQNLTTKLNFGTDYITVQRRDSMYYTTDLSNWTLVEDLPWDFATITNLNGNFYAHVSDPFGPPGAVSIKWQKSFDLGATWSEVTNSSSSYNIADFVFDYDNAAIYFYNSLSDRIVGLVTNSNSNAFVPIITGIDDVFPNDTEFFPCGNDEFLFTTSTGVSKVSNSLAAPLKLDNGLGYLPYTLYTDHHGPFAVAVRDSVYISNDYGDSWTKWNEYYAFFVDNELEFPYYVNIFKIDSGMIYINKVSNGYVKFNTGTNTFEDVIVPENTYEGAYFSEDYFIYSGTSNDSAFIFFKSLTSQNNAAFSYPFYFETYFSPISTTNFVLVTMFDDINTGCYVYLKLDLTNSAITDVEIPSNLDPCQVYFINVFNGKIVLVSDNEMYYTTDFINWLPYSPVFPETYDEVYLLSNITVIDSVVVDEDNGSLFVSLDGGFSFSEAGIEPIYQYWGGNYLDYNPAYLFTSNQNGLYKTSNFISTINAMTGHVYHDENLNNMQDSTEMDVLGVAVYNDAESAAASTNAEGNYTMALLAVPDTLTPKHYSPYVVFEPVSAVVQSYQDFPVFAMHLLENKNDLKLSMSLPDPFRPGFESGICLNLTNLGTTTQDALVKLKLPQGLEIVSVEPSYSSFADDTMTWAFTGIMPLDHQMIVLTVKTDTTTPIETALHFFTQATGSPLELTPNNNKESIYRIVVGAYDPNDKKVSSEVINPDLSAQGEYLDYTIRFQNTGNYPASFVRITDSLSTKLDLGSIEIVSASHEPMTWQIKPGRVLEFSFNPISLPDSTSNEPESHGFIRFKIKTIPGLQLNDLVENNADIFFDYNPAVRTNTAKTQMTTATQDIISVESLDIIPNPNQGSFSFALPTNLSGEAQVEVFDSKGALVFDQINQVSTGRSTTLDTNLPPGFYTLRVVLGGRAFAGQIVIGE
jgi:uncharacterized repeat protein (TIGR01451 family)